MRETPQMAVFQQPVAVKGENKWNPWVKYLRSVQKNAPAADFVNSFVRFTMMAYPMLREAG
jgi:hypothetical protein